ncbi:hypothetical protein HII36_16295 [Nonomuraea sp. NN258]|uniref:hypothetical protein n=1 Tax=Nonomuraea antri TaxID=2730852 RepID=UPI00156836DB|nr:hypothetical protein [Nonomuraea antri]NRQ33395.1 hypothetical protein [Nonomuraea antri]
MRPGDKLIEKIRDGDTSAGARDKATSYLLHELGKGYPPRNLARLLTSDNPDAVEAGAWLLAEQGRHGVELRHLAVPLLGHPAEGVRFWAIDSLVTWATIEDAPALALAIAAVADDSRAVRWKALHFLTATGPSELAAGAASLPDPALRTPALWLAGQNLGSFDRDGILARLGSPDPLTATFAVAAAKRLITMDRTLLEHATRVADDELARYAERELETG